jgi:hypothetical protein
MEPSNDFFAMEMSKHPLLINEDSIFNQLQSFHCGHKVPIIGSLAQTDG